MISLPVSQPKFGGLVFTYSPRNEEYSDDKDEFGVEVYDTDETELVAHDEAKLMVYGDDERLSEYVIASNNRDIADLSERVIQTLEQCQEGDDTFDLFGQDLANIVERLKFNHGPVKRAIGTLQQKISPHIPTAAKNFWRSLNVTELFGSSADAIHFVEKNRQEFANVARNGKVELNDDINMIGYYTNMRHLNLVG